MNSELNEIRNEILSERLHQVYTDMIEQYISDTKSYSYVTEENETNIPEEETQVRNNDSFKKMSNNINNHIISLIYSSEKKSNLISSFINSYNDKNLQHFIHLLSKFNHKCMFTNSLLLFNKNELAVNNDDLSEINTDVTINKLTESDVYLSTNIKLVNNPINNNDDDYGHEYFEIKFPINLHFSLTFTNDNSSPIISVRQYKYHINDKKNPIHPYIESGAFFNPSLDYLMINKIDCTKPLSYFINHTIKYLNTYNASKFKRSAKTYIGHMCGDCGSYTYDQEHVKSTLTNNYLHLECSVTTKESHLVEKSRAKQCNLCNNYTIKFVPVGKNIFRCEECINA